MPIQDNVVLVREGGEKDGKKLGVFFTSTSPRHSVVPHEFVLHIGENVEPTISLEIVAHVLEIDGYGQELASLHENINGRNRKK